MSYTVLTAVLIIFGYFQLRSINKTTSAEFTHKIKNDFYTESNIYLLTLFDENALMVDTNGEVAWFYIDTVKYKSLRKNIDLHTIPLIYQSNQIDALLQNFEDLGLYERNGLIDIDYIYEGFDYYVEALWDNQEVHKYIIWLRKDPRCADDFSYFEYLYKKLKKHPLNTICK